MDGKYFNEKKAMISIQNWANIVTSPKNTWKGNNLHIDEITGLKRIKRSEWIETSLKILNILSNQLKFINSLILFLHIDLKDSQEKRIINKLKLDWLKENVDEYTPPSLHFTSKEYYNDFYEKELIACRPDNAIQQIIRPSSDLDFFFRTYFDIEEEMYSGEIYVFMNR